MPNNRINLISLAAANKSGAEIVVLEWRRPRQTWRRLEFVLARLGLLARSTEFVVQPPRAVGRRGPYR